jgi:alkanesulfonate monooxygenase SsuD/methylene tetrahydromethanopterin reductase-like flavin-dependent oxidoreductase (luciferase family)
MKFGLMTQIQMPRPWGPGAELDAFANAIEQAAAGEAHGFEYFWITEQHFYYEIGHCSAPDIVLAAISQRTRTLRLGFAVILVPCHNPFYVAERVATLDVLSNGRAEFGSGRGTSPYVVEGLGFDPAVGREVGREAMGAILEMFAQDWFPGHKGKHFDLPARHVVPRPLQQPHPPLWYVASNFETYEHAGRDGVGIIGVTRNTPAETRPAIAAYRDAVRRSQRSDWLGKRRNEQVGVYAIGACDTDDSIGRQLACAAARWYYGDNDAEVNKHRFGSAKEGARQIVEKIARRSDDALIEDAMAIGGNPDTVCRQVEKWAQVGIDQMIFMFQAGHMTHDQVMRSIELVGDNVLPRFA